jgi:UTP--glucose-1-phosphate uridylyltransferase
VSEQGLSQSIEKMRADGAPQVAVDTFAHYYERLAAGEQGTLAESEIEPVEHVPDAEELPPAGDRADELLDSTVVIRLNGGLGTSMGMTRAKSLLEAKDGLSFLDVIARQVLGLREGSGARLPLVLMNSFATRDDSLAALDRYEGISADLPGDFVQGRVPKIDAGSLEPATWPDDPELEWAPPGHGDIYTSLVTSGMLEKLIDGGYRYALVANSDNLGATLEPSILAWFAGEGLPFAMEVADRTEADKKGGHIARRRDGGGLVLREVAQTPDEDAGSFQDVGRHRYFNTNNLWLDLRALDELMRGGPRRLIVARRLPARDRDGCRDRRVRGRRRHPRAARAARACEDHRRPARAALRRLRAARRRAARAGARARRPRPVRGPRQRSLQAAARLRRAFPRRAPVARRLRAARG